MGSFFVSTVIFHTHISKIKRDLTIKGYNARANSGVDVVSSVRLVFIFEVMGKDRTTATKAKETTKSTRSGESCSTKCAGGWRKKPRKAIEERER
jgi:hypothetical protein